MSEVLNLNAHEFVEQRVNAVRHDKRLWHHVHDHWPAEIVELEAVCSTRTHRSFDAVIERCGGAARVNIDGGIAYVNAYGPTMAAASSLLDWLREQVPRTGESDPGLVPVTFWTLSPLGPQSMRRMIDAPAFDDIETNYPAAGELLSLLRDWRPGLGGQLLLWHGDAGTGKTTALRSLGREWREWSELHYIVDPDKFFGDSASYMMQVMMGAEGEIEGKAADEAKSPMWRLLVLEDCGELLAPDARREVGQALSRLLNACDGLIGRGLRVLILVTTNEPLEKVHPAISRPGRCAARIEFERFSPLMARAWVEHGGGVFPQGGLEGSVTLADLYAIREGYRTENGKRPVGFTP